MGWGGFFLTKEWGALFSDTEGGGQLLPQVGLHLEANKNAVFLYLILVGGGQTNLGGVDFFSPRTGHIFCFENCMLLLHII